jgi:hypothetical protein
MLIITSSILTTRQKYRLIVHAALSDRSDSGNWVLIDDIAGFVKLGKSAMSEEADVTSGFHLFPLFGSFCAQKERKCHCL